jgi:hypothetical protein
MRFLPSVFLLSTIVAACGGSVAPIGDGSSGGSGGGSSGGSSGTHPIPQPVPQPTPDPPPTPDPGPPTPGACASPPSPGTTDPCLPVGGVYAAHFVKDVASSTANCTDIPDSETTVNPSDINQPSPGCTTTEDKNACVYSGHCFDNNSGGVSTTTDSTISTCGGALTGTVVLDVTGASAQHCVYTVVMTKK